MRHKIVTSELHLSSSKRFLSPSIPTSTTTPFQYFVINFFFACTNQLNFTFTRIFQTFTNLLIRTVKTVRGYNLFLLVLLFDSFKIYLFKHLSAINNINKIFALDDTTIDSTAVVLFTILIKYVNLTNKIGSRVGINQVNNWTLN